MHIRVNESIQKPLVWASY